MSGELYVEKRDGPPPPLRSVHTSNLSSILDHLGISLLVTTYQAGKLVVVRPDVDNPNLINTHFRGFNKPMGLAVGNQRLAIGTAQEIVQFRNVPAVAEKLEPAGKHDACFLPRSLHVTGDIQVHEMVYRGDELWFANTAFSCLCTYDEDHSFVPQWRPRFVTELTPEDRCHLNGLGLFDGKPRWVTALGETNTAGGWRENKKDGGILIDLAFVGLSQVRETAVFSGIPITERLHETDRTCGVWAVDIRNRDIVAFIKFEDAVQEIFAVSTLAGVRFPDLINEDPKVTGSSFVLPDAALQDVPDRLRPEGFNEEDNVHQSAVA